MCCCLPTSFIVKQEFYCIFLVRTYNCVGNNSIIFFHKHVYKLLTVNKLVLLSTQNVGAPTNIVLKAYLTLLPKIVINPNLVG